MSPLDVPLPAQAKAVLAGVIAGLSAFLPLMPDGYQPTDAVTADIAALIAYAAVFQVPNTPPGEITPADLAAAEQEDDTGYRGAHRRPDTGTVAGLPADDGEPR